MKKSTNVYLLLEESIQQKGNRPIFFIGSGISRRYLNSPNWQGLLEELIKKLKHNQPFAYFSQKHNSSYEKIASELVDFNFECAWGNFALYKKEFYSEKYNRDIFLKIEISALFKNLLSNYPPIVNKIFEKEIKNFSQTNPTAIITTNYDEFLEKIVFKKFKTTVGQKIIKEHLKGNNGKILKIHGCVTKPETIVISELDYENFIFRQKYLSAKLLTYFVEYPIIIMGYSISDRNILSILQTISEINILGESIKQRADNIWFINYSYSNLDEYDTLLEKEIVLPNNKVIVINIINVRAFDKLFQSIINTNQFPFSLTAVAVELDYTHWKQIEKYMDAIEKTDNLKISDNIKYCTKYKSIKRYSEEFYKRVKQVKSSSSGV